MRTLAARLVDHHRFVAGCIASGLAMRLVWVVLALVNGTAPVSDAGWYYARAASIAAGEGYVVNGVPTAYWPVGYPGFLGTVFSITGVSVAAGAIANLLLWLGTVLAAYRIARTMLGSERAARITLVLMAAHPNNIAYTSLLMSEPLALFLMLAGTLLAIGRRKGADGGSGRPVWQDIGAGLLFGALVLVKPQFALLPALVYAFAAWQTRGAKKIDHGRKHSPVWRQAAMAYAATALVVIPWTLRNHAVFGEYGIIANNGGINLYIGNNPDANGTYLLDEEIEARYHTRGSEPARNSKAQRLAIAYITEHPGEALARIPRKLWYYLRSDIEGFRLNEMGSPGYNGNISPLYVVLQFTAQCYWVLLVAFGIAAVPLLVRLRRSPSRPLRYLGLGVMVYVSAIPVIFFGDARFHFTAVPWLMMYVALFLAHAIGGRDEGATV